MNALTLVSDSEENSMIEGAKEWGFGSQKSQFCSVFRPWGKALKLGNLLVSRNCEQCAGWHLRKWPTNLKQHGRSSLPSLRNPSSSALGRRSGNPPQPWTITWLFFFSFLHSCIQFSVLRVLKGTFIPRPGFSSFMVIQLPPRAKECLKSLKSSKVN